MLTFLISGIVSGQSKITTDALFLNNGSIIFGEIQEQAKGKTKIKTLSYNILIFENPDIKRIKNDTVIMYKFPLRAMRTKDSGLYWHTNTGLLSGSNTAFSFQSEIGYSLNAYLRTGIGGGFEFFRINTIPLYASATALLFDNRFSPLINFKGGYSFAFGQSSYWYYNSDYFKGGINLEFSLGWKFQVSDYFEWTMSFGYRYQRLIEEIDGTTWDSDYYEKNIYDINRISIRFGFNLY